MINFLNNFIGTFIRWVSLILLNILPSLWKQLELINKIIITTNKNGEQSSKMLYKTLIGIEDKRYFNHAGVDIYSILRAVVKNFSSGRLQGASTINQQLVRTITGEREIKAKRKIKEIMLSVLIDKKFSKDEILKAYFNFYRFKRLVGVKQLCKMENYHFYNLSLNECAQIAARFKYPTINQKNYIKYLKRVRMVEILYNKDNNHFSNEIGLQKIRDIRLSPIRIVNEYI